MRLQVNMNCIECNEVLPVRVKADDKFEIKTTIKPFSNKDITNIYEQIPCPKCGEDNLWDRLNRRFTHS